MLYGSLIEYRALVTFPSLTQSLGAERVLKRLDCPYASIPTPRSVRSGCNTAICFPIERREIIEDLIDSGVVFLGAYEATDEGFTNL
ncbi:hypothetical protein Dhaf_1220 [Desulfitobacterium hafniense DCB-2]|uniref:Putative Se/S carrier protein-like domain-containing protein n=1 Tax=Desulfitobacterium hafniense (strain DSM 10664 / DCB-2) TaxID=272564 RepID=B8G162_DESHD|nr:DUF3343 domain-containing protein [Desulfitobacterium hafniense]ACL19277.1 hypothetical protein Dhaf_1220 [Desulfitobacterium hafniense DCB-2]